MPRELRRTTITEQTIVSKEVQNHNTLSLLKSSLFKKKAAARESSKPLKLGLDLKMEDK